MDLYGYLILAGFIIVVSAILITMFSPEARRRLLRIHSGTKIEPPPFVSTPSISSNEAPLPQIGDLSFSLPSVPVMFKN